MGESNAAGTHSMLLAVKREVRMGGARKGSLRGHARQDLRERRLQGESTKTENRLMVVQSWGKGGVRRGRWVVTDQGDGLGDDKNILELMVEMAAQLPEYTKNHGIAHSRYMYGVDPYLNSCSNKNVLAFERKGTRS